MKYFLFIPALLFLFFASCEPSHIKEGKKMYQDYIKSTLKDPNSLVFYEERIIGDSPDLQEMMFYVDYGAKNSYGAMARDNHYITVNTKKDYLIVDGEFVGKVMNIYMPSGTKDSFINAQMISKYEDVKKAEKELNQIEKPVK